MPFKFFSKCLSLDIYCQISLPLQLSSQWWAGNPAREPPPGPLVLVLVPVLVPVPVPLRPALGSAPYTA